MKKKDNFEELFDAPAPKVKKTPAKKSFNTKVHEIVVFSKVMAGILTGLVFLSYGGYAVYRLANTSNAAWRIAFAVWATSSIMAGFVILWRTVQKVGK